MRPVFYSFMLFLAMELLAVNSFAADTPEILDSKHSYANSHQIQVTHTHLDITIDFNRKVLKGVATLEANRVHGYKGTTLNLDAHKLKITKIFGDVTSSSQLTAKNGDEPISIQTHDKDTLIIRIDYETSPDAPGIMWLDSKQTDSGHPFMFAQNEPTNYRSMAPGQDTPAVRGTFSADIKIAQSELIKEPLLALVSGQNNPTETNEAMDYQGLRSDVPIPTYLFVIVAGRLKYRAQTDRIAYYAETDEMLDTALEGFTRVPGYLSYLENRLGSCLWQKQHFVLMPRKFPFGGMENPGAVFINSAIVDKKGLSDDVLGHEMAHMWTGNKVTNEKWSGFWLNEGTTTAWQNKAVGAIRGEEFRQGLEYEEYLELIALNEERLLAEKSGQSLPSRPTWLHKRKAKADNPDHLTDFSVYPKGANFFRNIENIVGENNFDRIFKKYVDEFNLKPIKTKQFISFWTKELSTIDASTLLHTLPGFNWQTYFQKWIYEPGLHPLAQEINVTKVYVPECTSCTEKLAVFKGHRENTDFSQWNRFQMAYLLDHIQKNIKNDGRELLGALLYCQSFLNAIAPIADTRKLWYQALVKGGMWRAKQDEIEQYLTSFGRGRLIKPLYASFINTEDPQDLLFAKRVFEANKDKYFKDVTNQIESLFKKAAEKKD